MNQKKKWVLTFMSPTHLPLIVTSRSFPPICNLYNAKWKDRKKNFLSKRLLQACGEKGRCFQDPWHPILRPTLCSPYPAVSCGRRAQHGALLGGSKNPQQPGQCIIQLHGLLFHYSPYVACTCHNPARLPFASSPCLLTGCNHTLFWDTSVSH